MSKGTVVLTGANGTLGLAFIAHTLKHYPEYHLVLTVRNNKPTNDPNTFKLHKLLSQFPNAKYTIHTVDLASPYSVTTFIHHISNQVFAGTLQPISTIVCNASTWSLTSGIQITQDGYEKTFQVNYLSHFGLYMGLWGCMDLTHGRIVAVSSDSHKPGGSAAEVFPPAFPDDIEKLVVNPPPDPPGEGVGRGLQRYGLSKLFLVMLVYELNHRLQNDLSYARFNRITCLAYDPGTMPDSRVTSQDVPFIWKIGMKYFLNPLQPILKYVMPSLRKSSTSGKELAQLCFAEEFRDRRAASYYEGLKPARSSEESYDEAKAAKLRDESIHLWGMVTIED